MIENAAVSINDSQLFGDQRMVMVLLLRYFDEITKHWSDNTVRPLAASFS